MAYFLFSSVHSTLGMGILEYMEKAMTKVSSSRGNDENDGLSEDTPFKTLTKVSQLELKPGSKLLLRASDVWQRQMLMQMMG